MKITHNPDPRPLRAAAYPSKGDQLDALWKIVDALLDLLSEPAPADAMAVRAQVKAVKARYVKKDSK